MKKYIKTSIKTFCITLLLCMYGNVTAQTWPPPGMQGAGTEASPWQITTASHLAFLAAYVNANEENANSTSGKYYKLMNNIDLQSYSNWTPIGAYFNTRFQGNFNGNNKVIQNLTIISVEYDTRGYGLFGTVSGIIQNLGIENCYIGTNVTSQTYYIGGLAGMYVSGTISNCYVTGKIDCRADYIGGLVGYLASSGNITNCYTTCNVYGLGVFGGGNFGGLVGRKEASCNISYCYASGTIKGKGVSDNGNYGGLIGFNSGVNKNCIAANDSVVSLSNNAKCGRIIGYNEYNTSQENCYALNTMVLNPVSSGGFNGISKTIEELQSLSFYTTSSNWSDAAWSITNPSGIWKICDEQSLPRLRWEGIVCAPLITTTTLPDATVGVAYSQTMTASGDTPISWSIESGNIPVGWYFYGTTGQLYGTATATGSYNFILKATNSAGSDTKPFTLTINNIPGAPTITATTLPNGIVGTTYNQPLTATGEESIWWSLVSGSLPPGLTLTEWPGSISGTPTAIGMYNFTVKATNNVGSDTKALTIFVTNASVSPTITTTTLPGGVTGTAYSQQLAATGTAPITWSLQSGALPNGLNLSSAGLISGTPTVAGTFNFTVKATNSGGSDTKALSIVIAAAQVAPTIITTSLPGGLVGTAYSQQLAATGTTPITWSLASGTLPTGLTLSTAGVISGTPTVANTFNFTVKATNSAGSDTKALSIAITTSAVKPTITTTTLPNGKIGTAYSAQLEATGTAPITWSLASGNLPTGLTLYSGGTISGTPTTTGTFNFTVQATNSAGNATKVLSIKIEDGVGVSENEMSDIKVYPNPTTGELSVVSEQLSVESIEIFDVYGRMLHSFVSLMSPKATVDISHLPAGVYFVKICTEAGEVIRKIVKE